MLVLLLIIHAFIILLILVVVVLMIRIADNTTFSVGILITDIVILIHMLGASNFCITKKEQLSLPRLDKFFFHALTLFCTF